MGKPALALKFISQVIGNAPPTHLALELRVLEAIAASLEGDAKRTHAAIERGFELAAGKANTEQSLKRLARLFDQINGGFVNTLPSMKVGKARVLFVPGRKKQSRLIGFCRKASSGWAQKPVRLYFDGHMVSETSVHAIPGGGGRGQFQFQIKRSTFADLGANAVSLEIAGVRYKISSKRFGKLWPRDFRKNRATAPELLSKLNQGYKLERGGVLAVPRNVNESWLRAVFGLYDRARAWFQSNYGYELYPVGGTLLGYARHGDVISFDNDFDTGYLSKHTSPDDIRREYKEIVLALLKDGLDVQIVTRSNHIRRDYFWLGDGQTHIDVFVGAFINGKYRRPTFVDTQLTPEDFFPFQSAKMSGYDILVPKNVEKKVAAVYGPGWRTPDPQWKKIRSPEILAYREQIGLTAQDLLEIAGASPKEGRRLRQLVESGALEKS